MEDNEIGSEFGSEKVELLLSPFTSKYSRSLIKRRVYEIVSVRGVLVKDLG